MTERDLQSHSVQIIKDLIKDRLCSVEEIWLMRSLEIHLANLSISQQRQINKKY